MNTEFIQLKGVTKKFRKNLVLDDVNLDVPEKQITGIIGASGMGKTTILKMIIGFYKPNKGKITYLKRNVLKDLKNIRQIFGFSTEDGSFYQDLTVKENLYHFGSLYGMKRKEVKERTKEILDFVGLSGAVNTKARDISVGMKKRLDFACSLVHKPEVLILDEPTADLDPLLRDQILSLIQKIKKTGTTVVLTTQLLEEMDKICDYIAILHNKKIIEKDTPKNIRKKYSSDDLNQVFSKIFSKTETDNQKHSEKDFDKHDKNKYDGFDKNNKDKDKENKEDKKEDKHKKSLIYSINPLKKDKKEDKHKKKDKHKKDKYNEDKHKKKDKHKKDKYNEDKDYKKEDKHKKKDKHKKDKKFSEEKKLDNLLEKISPEKNKDELKEKQEFEKKILSKEKESKYLLGKLFSGNKENKTQDNKKDITSKENKDKKEEFK
ncbi:MAG: ABC transporter ATP-binding protein [Minisyncoccales bacterium]